MLHTSAWPGTRMITWHGAVVPAQERLASVRERKILCGGDLLMSAVSSVFFDLGDTLGTAVFSASPQRLIRFDIFPFVPGILRSLADRHLRLGIISNTGDMAGAEVDAVLAAAGIRDYFDPSLRIYSKDVELTKNSPEIFKLAAQRAGLAAS